MPKINISIEILAKTIKKLKKKGFRVTILSVKRYRKGPYEKNVGDNLNRPKKDNLGTAVFGGRQTSAFPPGQSKDREGVGDKKSIKESIIFQCVSFGSLFFQ